MRRIHVVLVRTHSPGNLGSAARACKAFGASLTLVDPRTDRDHPDALAHASGAEDVLAAAPIAPGLDEIRGRVDRLLALTSLRGRVTRGLPPRVAFSSVRRNAFSQRVALVFGPERSGLTTEEVRACDGRVTIATMPEFPTLNLAQSVAVALALAAPAGGRGPLEPLDGSRATSSEVGRLRRALESTLESARYPHGGKRRSVLAELETSLERGRLTSREVGLWLGALAALQRSGRP